MTRTFLIRATTTLIAAGLVLAMPFALMSSPHVEASTAPPCPAPLGVTPSAPDLRVALASGITLRVWQAQAPDVPGSFPVAAVTIAGSRARVEPVMGPLPYPLDPRRPLGSRQVVASVNGDYFDYLTKNAVVPRGLVVAGGDLRYAPVGWSRVVAIDASGQARSTWARLEGFTRIAGRTWRIHALNDPRPRGGNVLFTDAWTAGSAPRRSGQAFVIVRNGIVTDIHLGDPVAVPRGGHALRLSSASARQVRVGDRAQVSVSATARDQLPLVSASGHGGSILRDGRVRRLCSTYENLRRPRTMIAWDRTARTWLLVSGTGPGSEVSDVRAGGSTKQQLALVARKLGATDGVVLDGGGSSAMHARIGGEVVRIDAGRNAWVRPVPLVWAVVQRD